MRRNESNVSYEQKDKLARQEKEKHDSPGNLLFSTSTTSTTATREVEGVKSNHQRVRGKKKKKKMMSRKNREAFKIRKKASQRKGNDKVPCIPSDSLSILMYRMMRGLKRMFTVKQRGRKIVIIILLLLTL